MRLLDQRIARDRPRDVSDARVLAEIVGRAMEDAVHDAIADHHRAGNPVVIWRDGRIVLWYPDGTYRPVEEEASDDVSPLTADGEPS
jgi:hypothetical protein